MVLPLPSFAFLHSAGSPNYLAIKDPLDVSLLSHPVMLKPVSAPLQRSIRFFQHPKLAQLSVILAANFPCKGAIQGFHVSQRKVLLV